MSEYSWRDGDKICGDSVPQDLLPQRIALTATGVVTKRQRKHVQLLLCNPHPGSWNSWMLPYGAVTVDVGDIETGTTFGELAAFMQQTRRQEAASYESTALAEAKRVAGMAGHEFKYMAALSNYSLKFSQSARLWTAYCFAYHAAATGESAEPSVQATWLSLDAATVKRILDNGEFEGLAVADNVLAVLRVNTTANMLVA